MCHSMLMSISSLQKWPVLSKTWIALPSYPSYTGNTGEALRNSPELYISRNGGVTLEQTLSGSWGVTLADHGGLMVAARDYHQEGAFLCPDVQLQ